MPRWPVRLAVLVFLVVPILAWFIVKPVRVVAPKLLGITCVAAQVCVDDAAQAARATALYDEAKSFVARNVGALQGGPKVIFCSTESCARSFGLGARSAVTLDTFGTVIGPRAWMPHYVRHELIHYLQSEQLGPLRLLFMPGWFVEGMAYGLSEDPRPALAEPFERQRREFRAWYGKIGTANLWIEARKLVAF